jgi:hypothetical protein
MKTQVQLTSVIHLIKTSLNRSLRLRFELPSSLRAAPVLLILSLAVVSALGGSATWNLDPFDNEWYIASNWTPPTVPDGPDDVATFGISSVTDIGIDIGFPQEVNGIVFDAGASPFTFTVFSDSSFAEILTISGVASRTIRGFRRPL